MLIKEKGMWETRRHACNSIVVKQRHAAADRQTPPDPYSTADVKAQTGLDWIASVSCALGFSWTLDCERVLAGGVSR